MAEHKRAFEVQVAAHQERSGLQEWLETTWKPIAVVLVLVAAVILYMQVEKGRADVELRNSWEQFRQLVDLSAMQQPGAGEEAALAAEELDGTAAGIWASALEVMAFVRDREYEKAGTALARLRSSGKSHPLLTEPRYWGGEEVAMALPDFLQRYIEDRQTWEQSYPGLFHNPPLPADAPRVRLSTSKGEIVVGLYADKAPKHVDNFLGLVADGFYEQTLFHRVVPGSLIQGGDPNSKEPDVDKWGLGGPGYEVEKEESGLSHFTGCLAAAKMPGAEGSSGSQFYITTAPAHQFDGDYTVFGLVLEGQDVVNAIGAGEQVQGTQRPLEPVMLESAVRL